MQAIGASRRDFAAVIEFLEHSVTPKTQKYTFLIIEVLANLVKCGTDKAKNKESGVHWKAMGGNDAGLQCTVHSGNAAG